MLIFAYIAVNYLHIEKSLISGFYLKHASDYAKKLKQLFK